jgi:hypothetical protein
LTQFVVIQSTPIILWYDRKITAPIAFPLYRKVHAVLFLDLHHVSNQVEVSDTNDQTVPSFEERVRERNIAALQEFGAVARDHRKWHPMDDIVFLVVPSTETRILTTFGIDIWSPLDAWFTSTRSTTDQCSAKDPENRTKILQETATDTLPTILLTDRRYHGTTRYYLDAKDIFRETRDSGSDKESTPLLSSMQQFFEDFWEGSLTPEIQSQGNNGATERKTNKSGVQIVTGHTFGSIVLERTNRHTLVQFYGPTCAHCKRFQIMWNKLSRLIRHLQWDDFFDVVKMDITQNEVPPHVENIDFQSVPDVYYFPKGVEKHTRAIRYSIVDRLGDGTGRLSNPLEIIDWVLNVGSREGNLDMEVLLSSLMTMEKDEPILVEAHAEEYTEDDANGNEILLDEFSKDDVQ